MNTISISKKHLSLEIKRPNRIDLGTIYNDIIHQADDESIVWYIKSVIVIPCVFMVLSILAMHYITDNFVWFVALSMFLFFANVLIHIVGLKAKYFVPLYYSTALVLFAIPLITYLIY